MDKTSAQKPILIYDKSGNLGYAIAQRLTDLFLRIVVSQRTPQGIKDIIYIRLNKTIPTLPNCVYSKFFIIYNRDIQVLTLLPFFVEKAKKDKARIYFFITVREYDEKLLEKVLTISSQITVVVIGDFFGKISFWSNPVTDIVDDAKTGRIILRSNGLEKTYPLYDEDGLELIKKLAYGEEDIKQHVLGLFPQHSVTAMSIARQLHRKEPLLDIVLSTEEVPDDKTMPIVDRYLIDSTYQYSEKLPSTVIDSKKKPFVKKVDFRNHNQLPLIRIGIICLLLGLLVGFGLPILSSGMGAWYLVRAQGQLTTGGFKKAHTSAIAAKQFFSFAEKTQGSFLLLNALGLGENVLTLQRGFVSGREVADTLILGIDGVMQFEKVFVTGTSTPSKDFSLGVQYIRESLAQLSALRVEDRIPEKYLAKVDSLEKIYNLFSSTADVLPTVLGMNEKRTYLVLFQNNMELRPGGGFIGSYGILEIDKGKITDFTIQDVYDADGQLKEHVAPPFQLQRYMGAKNWFLRDSNFDVDFSKSAASAASFYTLETGNKVQGVIAFDTSFVKNLLQEIGPVKVQGYTETVNAENFFLLTQKYVQEDFFPGSTQKKDFLRAVYTSLSLLMTEGNTHSSYYAIANALAKSVSQKHVLFAFPDKNIQAIFTLNGFSSALQENRVIQEGQFNDFLGINEANIGANKVNYYLDRAVNHQVSLTNNGSLTETVTVQYNNKSTIADVFGGEYKFYIRFILPLQAELESVNFDGVNQKIAPAILDASLFPPAGIKTLNELEVEKSEELGKRVYGFFTNVPMNSKKIISIQYSIPKAIVDGQASNTYSLYLFKQPGTEADPYVFNLTVPTSYLMRSDNKRVNIDGTTLSYIADLSEDRELSTKIIRK